MRRAVLFDMFNTLIPGGDDGTRDAALTEMAAILDLDAPTFIAALTDTWPQRSVGAFGDAAGEIRTIARRLGGSPSADQIAAAVMRRRELTASLFAAASPAALSVLDGLRVDGWSTGLVSNTATDTHRLFPDSPLAGRFDVAGFSSELRVKKPDPDIYLGVCSMLGVEPTACVYVGDGADRELAAAASLGMHVIRTTEHADTDPTWTGPTITRLADLPPLLAR